MGIFDLFTTAKEKATKDILGKKPQLLMHTSSIFPDKIHSIRPSFNKDTNTSTVFATDNEKIAALYTLQPFYSFKFGKDEIGVIILGNHHDLLKIDSKIAYTYFVDSSSFNPIVGEDGSFNHEWISTNEVPIKKDVPARKIVYNDVLRSGIQVFWVNNITTLLEIDKQLLAENIVTGNQKLEYLINQTNWKPDKVMYMNAFRKICPAIQTDSGWMVNYNNGQQVNQPQVVEQQNTTGMRR